MSIIKTVLAGVGLAAVGYGVYRGAKLASEIVVVTDGKTADMIEALMTSATDEGPDAAGWEDGAAVPDLSTAPGASMSPA